MSNNIDKSLVDLGEQLICENNTSDLNDIVNLFNINLQKKNIIRSAKLSEVQDKVVQQISERFDKRADEFSNDDLIKYHKIIQETIDKTDTTLDNVKTPQIQINSQVNVNTFDTESRKRILEAVSYLTSLDTAIDVTEEDMHDRTEDEG